MAERKIVAYNRKASHDYFLEDRFEAGLELQGTEIKSVRNGKVQLKDAYISFVNNEAFVKEMHISPYTYGNRCCTGMRSASCSRRSSSKAIPSSHFPSICIMV